MREGSCTQSARSKLSCEELKVVFDHDVHLHNQQTNKAACDPENCTKESLGGYWRLPSRSLGPREPQSLPQEVLSLENLKGLDKCSFNPIANAIYT